MVFRESSGWFWGSSVLAIADEVIE